MKILVTGGTGFLGRHVVRRLIDAGDFARVLARPGHHNGAGRRGITHGGSERAEEIAGDLRDAASLKRAVEGVDAICHCAAHRNAASPWSEFEEVTVRGTERLLEAAYQAKVNRFLHVSSLGVYGLDGNKTITEESPFDENIQSRGYYTRSKVEAERLVWKYSCERGVPVTVIRPGVLYGPGRRPFTARFCVSVAPKLRIVIGQPQQLLPLAFVENVADAIQLALGSHRAVGRAYNVVDDPIAQETYLALLKQVDLTPPGTVLVPPTPFYPLISLLEFLCRSMKFTSPVSRHQLERAFASLRYDTSRVRRELGWVPNVTTPEALKRIREARSI